MIACVVGGAGFLGRRVVKLLAQEGHDVVGLDINMAATPVDFGPKVRWARMDVTNFEEVIATFATFKPDIVVHLSFMRENFPRPAMKLNVLGLDNTLEAARLCNVRRVVYSSSIAVNGKQTNYGDKAIDETDPPAPEKQYDVHKVFNEWQAKEYREKHGMSVIGIRAANVSGTDKTIGSVDHVDCIVKPAAGERVVLDYRDRMRCVVHGADVAQVFVRTALAQKPKHDLYYSGGEPLSLGQIADMVRRIIPDADIRFEKETGGKDISGAYLFNYDRLKTEFGVQYMPYERRIAEMIENVRKNVHLG